jgi:hypothetical protein
MICRNWVASPRTSGKSLRRASLDWRRRSRKGRAPRDQRVEVNGGQFGCRHARVVAEIVDHALHRLHLGDDGLRRTVEHLGVGAAQVIGKLHLQALGGELDRRQRVLDLVRQAPRHFAPGGTALGGDQPRHVVEDDDIASVRLGGSWCRAGAESAAGHRRDRVRSVPAIRAVVLRQRQRRWPPERLLARPESVGSPSKPSKSSPGWSARPR